MKVVSREFALLYQDQNNNSVDDGTFEVGGGFFKCTKDYTYTAGSGARTFQLWDYGFPFLDWDPPNASTQFAPLYIDSVAVAYGFLAPNPSADTAVNWAFGWYNGSIATGAKIHQTASAALSVGPPSPMQLLYVPAASFNGSPIMPTAYAVGAGGATLMTVQIQPASSVTASLFRIIVHGRFM